MPEPERPAIAAPAPHPECAAGSPPAVSPAMPEDEPLSLGAAPSAAGVREVTVPIRLPEAAETVVARWNPQGMALLEAARADDGVGQRVLLIGVDDANTALLRAELARFAPRIELSDPVVEPTRPVGVALVLLDAGSPLGTHTMRVASRLWADGARMVFAINGIHAHPDWQAVRDRDLELLNALCPQHAEVDIIPVAPQLAIAARTSADAALCDRAGIGLLHARLAAATGALTAADQANAVLKRVLADTRHRIHAQIAALRSGAEVAALREERVTLLSVSDGGRSIAMSTLHNRLQLARVDLVHEIGARIRSLNIAARAEVERLGRTEQRDYPKILQRSVNQLTADIDTEFLHRLVELAEVIEQCMEPFDQVVRSARAETARAAASSEQLPPEYRLAASARDESAARPRTDARDPARPNDPDPEHDSAFDHRLRDVPDARVTRRDSSYPDSGDGHRDAPRPLSRAAQRPVTPRVGPDPEPRRPGVEDRLMIVVGASAGFGLGRLIVSPFALVPALDYASVPLTLLLGAAVAAWLARARGQLADRAHLRQWIADALVNVKAQLEQRVAAVLVDAEDQLTDQVVRSATRRVVEADRRVGEIEALLKASAARRPAQLAACERDLDTLEFE
ncbi:hypothetical protein [Nocardia sp. NPDC050406]|uniref:hypothetical protein n=1 Tax=Nocardia sp. NPDC050406 TaxID=3364318 RepID=UPI0037985E5C